MGLYPSWQIPRIIKAFYHSRPTKVALCRLVEPSEEYGKNLFRFMIEWLHRKLGLPWWIRNVFEPLEFETSLACSRITPFVIRHSRIIPLNWPDLRHRPC
jgi:hypothetical protein